jgi:exosortase H (IPTLxxWG-CTERM-specific)
MTGKAGTGDGRREGLRFCLLFGLLTVTVFIVLYAVEDNVITAVNRHVAWAVATIIGALGPRGVAAGAVVTVGDFGVEIKNNCNAVYEAGLFMAAVWAYPAPARAKVLGTLAGISVLYLLNLLRVVSLLGLGILARDWFAIVHLYVWQALFLVVVATCWFGWILRLPPRT